MGLGGVVGLGWGSGGGGGGVLGLGGGYRLGYELWRERECVRGDLVGWNGEQL